MPILELAILTISRGKSSLHNFTVTLLQQVGYQKTWKPTLNLSQMGKDSYWHQHHWTGRFRHICHYQPSDVQMGGDRQTTGHLRRTLLRRKRDPSSIPGSWMNWTLNVSVVSPVISPRGILRPISITWSLMHKDTRTLSKPGHAHLRPTPPSWLLLLVLMNLRWVLLRTGRPINMPFWLTHWLWNNELFMLTKWIPLSHPSAGEIMRKLLKKSALH